LYKYIGLILLLLLTNVLHAKDFLPCKTNLNTYSLEQGSYFKTCSLNDSKFIFRSVEIGKMGHTCNIEGTAIFNKQQYHYTKSKCVISFTAHADPIRTPSRFSLGHPAEIDSDS